MKSDPSDRPENPLTMKVLPVIGTVFFALLGLGMIFAATIALELDQKFEQHGIITQAAIERLWTTTRNKNTTYYHVQCKFSDGNSNVRTINDLLPRDYWARTRLGDVLPVKYLPDNPGRNRIDWAGGDQLYRQEDRTELWFGMAILGVSVSFYIFKLR
jgi:hypothetical protein